MRHTKYTDGGSDPVVLLNKPSNFDDPDMQAIVMDNVQDYLRMENRQHVWADDIELENNENNGEPPQLSPESSAYLDLLTEIIMKHNEPSSSQSEPSSSNSMPREQALHQRHVSELTPSNQREGSDHRPGMLPPVQMRTAMPNQYMQKDSSQEQRPQTALFPVHTIVMRPDGPSRSSYQKSYGSRQATQPYYLPRAPRQQDQIGEDGPTVKQHLQQQQKQIKEKEKERLNQITQLNARQNGSSGQSDLSLSGLGISSMQAKYLPLPTQQPQVQLPPKRAVRRRVDQPSPSRTRNRNPVPRAVPGTSQVTTHQLIVKQPSSQHNYAFQETSSRVAEDRPPPPPRQQYIVTHTPLTNTALNSRQSMNEYPQQGSSRQSTNDQHQPAMPVARAASFDEPTFKAHTRKRNHSDDRPQVQDPPPHRLRIASQDRLDAPPMQAPAPRPMPQMPQMPQMQQIQDDTDELSNPTPKNLKKLFGFDYNNPECRQLLDDTTELVSAFEADQTALNEPRPGMAPGLHYSVDNISTEQGYAMNAVDLEHSFAVMNDDLSGGLGGSQSQQIDQMRQQGSSHGGAQMYSPGRQILQSNDPMLSGNNILGVEDLFINAEQLLEEGTISNLLPDDISSFFGNIDTNDLFIGDEFADMKDSQFGDEHQLLDSELMNIMDPGIVTDEFLTMTGVFDQDMDRSTVTPEPRPQAGPSSEFSTPPQQSETESSSEKDQIMKIIEQSSVTPPTPSKSKAKTPRERKPRNRETSTWIDPRIDGKARMDKRRQEERMLKQKKAEQDQAEKMRLSEIQREKEKDLVERALKTQLMEMEKEKLLNIAKPPAPQRSRNRASRATAQRKLPVGPPVRPALPAPAPPTSQSPAQEQTRTINYVPVRLAGPHVPTTQAGQLQGQKRPPIAPPPNPPPKMDAPPAHMVANKPQYPVQVQHYANRTQSQPMKFPVNTIPNISNISPQTTVRAVAVQLANANAKHQLQKIPEDPANISVRSHIRQQLASGRTSIGDQDVIVLSRQTSSEGVDHLRSLSKGSAKVVMLSRPRSRLDDDRVGGTQMAQYLPVHMRPRSREEMAPLAQGTSASPLQSTEKTTSPTIDQKPAVINQLSPSLQNQQPQRTVQLHRQQGSPPQQKPQTVQEIQQQQSSPQLPNQSQQQTRQPIRIQRVSPPQPTNNQSQQPLQSNVQQQRMPQQNTQRQGQQTQRHQAPQQPAQQSGDAPKQRQVIIAHHTGSLPNDETSLAFHQHLLATTKNCVPPLDHNQGIAPPQQDDSEKIILPHAGTNHQAATRSQVQDGVSSHQASLQQPVGIKQMQAPPVQPHENNDRGNAMTTAQSTAATNTLQATATSVTTNTPIPYIAKFVPTSIQNSNYSQFQAAPQSMPSQPIHNLRTNYQDPVIAAHYVDAKPMPMGSTAPVMHTTTSTSQFVPLPYRIEQAGPPPPSAAVHSITNLGHQLIAAPRQQLSPVSKPTPMVVQQSPGRYDMNLRPIVQRNAAPAIPTQQSLAMEKASRPNYTPPKMSMSQKEQPNIMQTPGPSRPKMNRTAEEESMVRQMQEERQRMLEQLEEEKKQQEIEKIQLEMLNSFPDANQPFRAAVSPVQDYLQNLHQFQHMEPIQQVQEQMMQPQEYYQSMEHNLQMQQAYHQQMEQAHYHEQMMQSQNYQDQVMQIQQTQPAPQMPQNQEMMDTSKSCMDTSHQEDESAQLDPITDAMFGATDQDMTEGLENFEVDVDWFNSDDATTSLLAESLSQDNFQHLLEDLAGFEEKLHSGNFDDPTEVDAPKELEQTDDVIILNEEFDPLLLDDLLSFAKVTGVDYFEGALEDPEDLTLEESGLLDESDVEIIDDDHAQLAELFGPLVMPTPPAELDPVELELYKDGLETCHDISCTALMLEPDAVVEEMDYMEDQLDETTEEEEEYYAKKLETIKNSCTTLTYSNAAMIDEISRVSHLIVVGNEERKALSRRLCHHNRNYIRRLQNAKKRRIENLKNKLVTLEKLAEINVAAIKAKFAKHDTSRKKTPKTQKRRFNTSDIISAARKIAIRRVMQAKALLLDSAKLVKKAARQAKSKAAARKSKSTPKSKANTTKANEKSTKKPTTSPSRKQPEPKQMNVNTEEIEMDIPVKASKSRSRKSAPKVTILQTSSKAKKLSLKPKRSPKTPARIVTEKPPIMVGGVELRDFYIPVTDLLKNPPSDIAPEVLKELEDKIQATSTRKSNRRAAPTPKAAPIEIEIPIETRGRAMGRTTRSSASSAEKPSPRSTRAASRSVSITATKEVEPITPNEVVELAPVTPKLSLTDPDGNEGVVEENVDAPLSTRRSRRSTAATRTISESTVDDTSVDDDDYEPPVPKRRRGRANTIDSGRSSRQSSTSSRAEAATLTPARPTRSRRS